MFHNIWDALRGQTQHLWGTEATASLKPKPWAVPSNLPIKETVRMGLQPMPCTGMWEPALFGPQPCSLLSRYPAQGWCLLDLPEGWIFGSYCHLKSSLQTSQKLLSWLRAHQGCHPWAGWFYFLGCSKQKTLSSDTFLVARRADQQYHKCPTRAGIEERWGNPMDFTPDKIIITMSGLTSLLA